jgi:hypothetical protein
MLSDQRSPYVGRFARGWRRLPRNTPGQPQTRTRARPSIGRAAEGPRGGQHVHLPRTGGRERLRAGDRRGAGGHDVVHEEHVARGAADRLEATAQRGPAVRSRPAGLRITGERTSEEMEAREASPACHLFGQHPRLVEPALRQPATTQRHPGHGLDRRDRSRGDHGPREGLPDAPPPRILEPMDRAARGAVEGERSASAADGRRGAVTAAGHGTRPRTPAALAPRRCQHDQGGAALRAERPRARAAARAPAREDHVEGPAQHPATLRRGADTTRAGVLTAA